MRFVLLPLPPRERADETMQRKSGEGRSYGVMWRRYKQRVVLAMSSQAFAQLNGINGGFSFPCFDDDG